MKENTIMQFLHDTEKKYGRGPDACESRCVTGDPVVMIMIGFTKELEPVIPEGGSYLHYGSEEKAWGKFVQAFEEYMEGRSGPIYWRRTPSMEINECGYHIIYARLFAVK